MTNYAPIVLFLYSRVDHAERTINALRLNILARESDLFIYSDHYRSEGDRGSVEAVRALIENLEGFKTVTIIKRSKNYGLARNIQEGVSSVIEKYGKVIVLEDDILTTPYFLSFMNEALNRYADIKKVWHVTGWNYPIDNDGLNDAFFWRTMNCWGWATWQDRWKYFDKDPNKLLNSWGKTKIKQFNLDGAHDFWSQIQKNATGRINTWAVFWYASIFENNGLCLSPTNSLVKNIGNDGTGKHCSDFDIYTEKLINKKIETWPDSVVENSLALERIKYFFIKLKKRFLRRGFAKIKKLIKF